MLTILATVLGFLGPFVPEVLKFFNRRQDNSHELEMMRLQMLHAEKAHAWKLEEINAHADIAEAMSLRQPQQSFGVQLLDAAKGWPAWAVLGLPALVLLILPVGRRTRVNDGWTV